MKESEYTVTIICPFCQSVIDCDKNIHHESMKYTCNYCKFVICDKCDWIGSRCDECNNADLFTIRDEVQMELDEFIRLIKSHRDELATKMCHETSLIKYNKTLECLDYLSLPILLMLDSIKCPTCNGKGEGYNENPNEQIHCSTECPTCNGIGRIEKKRMEELI